MMMNEEEFIDHQITRKRKSPEEPILFFFDPVSLCMRAAAFL
jgi:hypothetical protein